MKRDIEALKKGDFDILIIGGGINGAGIARDASLRGFKVALLEKGDFASGTSSKSSKLIHGGLRYLEQGNFKLVYEACHERSILLRIAPHLVKPLRFILPIYRDDPRSAFIIKCGMALYDALAGFKNVHPIRNGAPRCGISNGVKPHKMISKEEVLLLEPNLRSNNLLKAALYYDCYMNDSRLCLENILSASQSGAVCVNYVEAIGFIREGLKIRAVKVIDSIGSESFEVRAKLFINAAGVWADEVLSYIGKKTRLVRPTKGVHIIIPNITKGNAILASNHIDKRPLFIIPSSQYTLIGTTDTDYNGSPDELYANKKDVDYILKEMDRLFPNLNIKKETIINTYSGLRPLVNPVRNPAARGAISNGVNIGQIPASNITREHRVYEEDCGIMTIIGGKYTTYRHMAKEVVDRASRYFPQRRSVACKTADIPLYGGDMGELENFARSSLTVLENEGISSASARHLINTYGSRWQEIFEIAREEAPLKGKLCEHNPHIKAEIVHAFKKEFASSISDFMFRRTWIGYSRCKGKDCLGTVLEIMSQYLGFDKDILNIQKNEYLKELEAGERFKRE